MPFPLCQHLQQSPPSGCSQSPLPSFQKRGLLKTSPSPLGSVLNFPKLAANILACMNIPLPWHSSRLPLKQRAPTLCGKKKKKDLPKSRFRKRTRETQNVEPISRREPSVLIRESVQHRFGREGPPGAPKEARLPVILSETLLFLFCLVLFLSGRLKERLSYFPRERWLQHFKKLSPWGKKIQFERACNGSLTACWAVQFIREKYHRGWEPKSVCTAIA